MKRMRWTVSPKLLLNCFWSVLSVAAMTGILLLIGRGKLGEAAEAMLFLLPVGLSAAWWGLWPSLCAALTAILAFDFFFIPPYYTFTVGGIEGWLALGVLALVAVVLVITIEQGLTRARASQHDGVYMSDLSLALAGLKTQDAVVHALAGQLQQMFQAALVEVFVESSYSPPLLVKAPSGVRAQGKPDRVVPILAAPEWAGEIRLWAGEAWLPAADSYLFRNLTTQAVLALERARCAEGQPSAAGPVSLGAQEGQA